MILQQTLSNKEKSLGLVAVIFLIGLVVFGYNQTVIIPTQASVLNTQKITQDYSSRYSKLTNEFHEVRQNLNSIKEAAVKSKLRSIKSCLIQANNKESSKAAIERCEKLFTETEIAIDSVVSSSSDIETSVEDLNDILIVYENLVTQALDELKKKNEAALGKIEH